MPDISPRYRAGVSSTTIVPTTGDWMPPVAKPSVRSATTENVDRAQYMAVTNKDPTSMDVLPVK